MEQYRYRHYKGQVVTVLFESVHHTESNERLTVFRCNETKLVKAQPSAAFHGRARPQNHVLLEGVLNTITGEMMTVYSSEDDGQIMTRPTESYHAGDWSGQCRYEPLENTQPGCPKCTRPIGAFDETCPCCHEVVSNTANHVESDHDGL